MIQVDIKHQWQNLARWWWDNNDVGISIWAMLEEKYNATKIEPVIDKFDNLYMNFPDEQSYTMFLLRWA